MTRPTKYLMAIISVTLLFGTACGDDSDSTASSGIDSEEAWCAVVEEVDADFTTLDESPEGGDADFAAQQELMAGIRTRLVDLDENLDQIDADIRDAVSALLAFNIELADLYATVDGPEELGEAVGPLFEQDQSASEAAGPWILEHCGVEV